MDAKTALDRLVAEEHSKLAPLFEAGSRALEDNDLPQIAEAIRDLHRAIDLHLTQEDKMYYPGLWALRPELRSSLERFIASHDRFRAELAGIEEGLGTATLEETRSRFEAFSNSFAAHEVHEEAFLRDLGLPAEVMETRE